MKESKEAQTYLIKKGSISIEFYFLTFISAAIATSGLLLNQPAFVIGSMLISPLSGPIGLLGLFLANQRAILLRRSLECLLVGAVMGILIAFSVAHFFPIKQITPEIMSRTHPTIFDLIVSSLAGLGFGYTLIQKDIEGNLGIIIGIGITTSLMPPLATVGFGLAAENYAIAMGSFILFLTNVLAIALGSSLVFQYFQLGGNKVVYGSLMSLVSIPLWLFLNINFI